MQEVKKKVFLDDQWDDPNCKRKPGDFYPGEKNEQWFMTADPREAYNYIVDHAQGLEIISLDCDLGDGAEMSGYEVAKMLEQDCFFRVLRLSHVELYVHSRNNVDGPKAAIALENAQRYSKRQT